MDPIIGGALINGVGSLLGGLLGSKKVSSRQASRGAIYGQAEGARLAAEKLGFNPLTLLAASSAVGGYDSANPMGAALADAAGALAEGVTAKAEREDELAKAREENAKLRERLTQSTIRPRVPGVFGSEPVRAAVGAEVVRVVNAAGMGAAAVSPPTPVLAAPTMVMRDDGLPAANPDAPAEAETDLWSAARRGTIIPFVQEIVRRNGFPATLDEFHARGTAWMNGLDGHQNPLAPDEDRRERSRQRGQSGLLLPDLAR